MVRNRRNFLESMNAVLGSVITVVLAVIFMVIVLQIVFRFILRYPLEWSEELARALNLWLVFLGAAVATAKNEHVRVDLIDKYLQRTSPVIKNLFSLLFLLLMGVFSLMVFGGAVFMARETWALRLVTLPLTTGILYLGLAVGFLFILINLGSQILMLLGNLRRAE